MRTTTAWYISHSDGKKKKWKHDGTNPQNTDCFSAVPETTHNYRHFVRTTNETRVHLSNQKYIGLFLPSHGLTQAVTTARWVKIEEIVRAASSREAWVTSGLGTLLPPPRGCQPARSTLLALVLRVTTKNALAKTIR